MTDAPETFALEFENISKTFHEKRGTSTRALDGISLSLRPGSIIALVGPDGAGKSTLLRIAAGLLSPDAGTFSLFGENITGNTSPAFARIAYMPQRFGLYEDLSVQENLNFYADLRGFPGSSREKRYAALLAMTGLSKFTDRLAGQLSGGMKQKLGLICTLVAPPDILLLDEPTVGVDPLSRRELWEIVATLTGKKPEETRDGDAAAPESKMSVIISTAYLDEAARCDEALLLFEGKTLTRETPEKLKKRSEGMAYSITPPEGEPPRVLQARLLTSPGVVDAVPEGGKVRLVHGALDEKERNELTERLGGAFSESVASSLEDSFMMLLRKEKSGAHHITPQERKGGESAGGAPLRPDAEEGSPVIETKNVTKKFGDFTAVNNVSFSVFRGEVFGLLGPNGAGKTTTFRMLCGLLPPTSGSLHVTGVDVGKAGSDARRRIGYVAQKFSLYGLLTVRENLEFFAGAYGLSDEKREERIRTVLEDFSLSKYAGTVADRLPGGNKQRLAMAAGLLHEPQILFLDEPTSGADPLARREFWLRISTLAAGGVTVIVTTHFMEEAEYCDRILIQDSGMMLALDAPAAIRARTGAPTMEEAFIRIVEKAREKNGKGREEGKA